MSFTQTGPTPAVTYLDKIDSIREDWFAYASLLAIERAVDGPDWQALLDVLNDLVAYTKRQIEARS